MRFQCLSEQIAAAPIPMDITSSQRMLSACAGVLTTSVVVTPMDVVKTRVQAAQAEAVGRHAAAARSTSTNPTEPCDKCRQQGRPFTTSARSAVSVTFESTSAAAAAAEFTSANSSAVLPRERPPVLPTGTVAALTHIARWEGPRGLYRGLDVSLLMAVPATVLYYTVYDDFLGRLQIAGAGNVLSPIAAGSTSRLIATIVMAPLELVRTRIQSNRSVSVSRITSTVGPGSVRALNLSRLPLASVATAVSKVFNEEGVLALWRGVGTTMWRDVPFSMIYWLGYENLKSGFGCGRGCTEDKGQMGTGDGQGLQAMPGQEKGSADYLSRLFAAGALSGAVASILTHPFDVVKTQQQVLVKQVEVGGCEHRPPPPRPNPGTFDVMRSIVASRGPGGLFTGSLARVGKVAPACAIMMFSYEAGKRFFGRKNYEAAVAAGTLPKE